MIHSIKEKVLEMFEKHRKTPGADFNEEHFLDYLMDSPKAKRAVYNSFSGLRRLNAFIDEIQWEFLIYFSVKDRDANYSLTKFAERIEELQISPRSSIASLNNALKYGFEWNMAIIFNLILLTLFAIFRNNVIMCLILTALLVFLNCKYINYYKKEKEYQKKLLNLITKQTP